MSRSQSKLEIFSHYITDVSLKILLKFSCYLKWLLIKLHASVSNLTNEKMIIYSLNRKNNILTDLFQYNWIPS